ncbi:MAG TPA: hypothetical protein VFD69_12820 [Vicinamibacterales bacterium]|nr:hypothetical protein [Vicinamibacterales bacterium]
MQAMKSGVQGGPLPRRRFLGSAAALGAGATIGATLSFPSIGVPLAAAGGQDLVHDELVRQLRDGVRALRGARPGEAARSVAATLRLLAAHYQATGVDAEFTSRLRATIARDGRDAVLRWEPDPAMFAAEARNFGVTLPLPREPLNLAERERALDGMLKNGCTPALLAAAAELSRRAPQLDRMALTPIAARQCPSTSGMVLSVEFIAAAGCLINPILCAGFMGALLGLKLGLWVAGC